MASSLRAEREKEDKEAISLVDIQSCTLRRGQLIDMLGHPAFEEYVVGTSLRPLPPVPLSSSREADRLIGSTGSFVRVLAPPLPGQKQGGYLLCEIVGTCFHGSLNAPDHCG